MTGAIAGLRAALADFPEDADILVVDETGGMFELQQVAGVVGARGPALVITVKKIGQDPSVDGWSGIQDLPAAFKREGK